MAKGWLVFGALLALAVAYVWMIRRASWESDVMTVPEMIESWGYPAEEHFVTTHDGYVIQMHRIPHGRETNHCGEDCSRKPVVFLTHCLLCSSSVFAFGPPDNSLGYLLADAGYDVWMGNTRGNTWSKNHTHLEPCRNCSEFWSFSWDDAALGDYPAEIDYILDTTGSEQLFFVGYSMGTSQYLVLLSERPEYNAKIKAGYLMAPVGIMKHARNPVLDLSILGHDFQSFLHTIGHHEFMPMDNILHWFAHRFCDDNHPASEIFCTSFFTLLFGIKTEFFNNTMMSSYIDHLPAGCSTHSWMHYAQLSLQKKGMQRYDWGYDANLARYGQAEPPLIDLTKVTAPTMLIVGDSDTAACTQDSEELASVLPNLIENHLVDFEGWTHLDFFMATNVREKVYDKILNHMNGVQ